METQELVSDLNVSEGGSTGTVLYLDDQNNYVCANVGDSPCYKFSIMGNKIISIEELITHHTCKNNDELARLGGLCLKDRYIGMLSPTRGFGDNYIRNILYENLDEKMLKDYFKPKDIKLLEKILTKMLKDDNKYNSIPAIKRGTYNDNDIFVVCSDGYTDPFEYNYENLNNFKKFRY